MKNKTHEVVDRAKEQRQGDGFRPHLGASIIGKECPRAIWYIFRWAKRAYFTARILRLFERGLREEQVITKMLRQSGIHVLDIDPTTGKQFHITDFDGHFGGSIDAKIYDCPDFPGMWALGEYKTHNEKSFRDLQRKGVKDSKPEHYAQTHLYMSYMKLPVGLYIAVNKNDDDLLFEPLELDEEIAERFKDKAKRIINARFPPQRINESPGWFVCQMCDKSSICHEGKSKALNCRTCIHSKPVEDGEWFCEQYNTKLPLQLQKTGCATWTEIPED